MSWCKVERANGWTAAPPGIVLKDRRKGKSPNGQTFRQYTWPTTWCGKRSGLKLEYSGAHGYYDIYLPGCGRRMPRADWRTRSPVIKLHGWAYESRHFFVSQVNAYENASLK